jgi:inward rectifier potassium channel
MSDRSRSRLLTHDGEFNVRRNNLGPFHRYNAYHTLLKMTVPKLLGLVAVLYLGVNFLFASLYWLAGPNALAGTEGSVRFEDCFFFSVQTLATIGYGKLVPNTRLANALVSLEALIGLLGFAVLSGLLFARFTRPSAKVSFSDKAIVAPYGSGWALMFRLANMRRHVLTDVHAVVSIARWVTVNGKAQRRFDLLPLERASIIFMPLHWVIVHPITDNSPLKGMTRESFLASDPELVCLISGHDETFAQTVHARISYDKGEIAWGARFRDIYTTDVDHVAVDLTRLSDYDEVDSPATV